MPISNRIYRLSLNSSPSATKEEEGTEGLEELQKTAKVEWD
jgi:hypothetical protein